VKERAERSVLVDVVQLFDRARRARDEAQRLLDDQRFIIS
jgi:hypothetical protein